MAGGRLDVGGRITEEAIVSDPPPLFSTPPSANRHPPSVVMTFRRLDSSEIIETLERLRQRIEERFPGSGLGRVAHDLLVIARQAATESEALGTPNKTIRVAVGLLTALMVGAVLLVLVAPFTLGVPRQFSGIGEYVQAVEAAVNDLVFLGLAVFFLFGIETRHKRRIALRAIHQLRSIAHVVDMHQLTKDPERAFSAEPDTASSPIRTRTPEQLGRYLDYCSELLSLVSKIAALYVQRFDDPATLEAVNDVENLADGLSHKIWQKIGVLRQDAVRTAEG